jgi:hypothetical protein
LDSEGKTRKEKHRALLVFAPLAVSVALRLYPSQWNQAPWGTDGWPLIRIANEILSHTPTSLGGSALFGNYDIYWPATSLFGSVSSLLFNSTPYYVMPIIVPLASSFTTLVFFTLVEKLTDDSRIACIASLLFTSASFDSIFTASATKETFAEPLFMAGILLLLIMMKDLKIEFRSLLVYSLIILTLSMAHHATSFIFLIIATMLTVGNLILGIGYRKIRSPRYVLLPTIALLMLSGYLGFYAIVALPFQITISSIFTVSSFLIASLTVAIYYVLADEKKINFLIPALIFFIGLGIFVASELTSIVPLLLVIPPILAFYALPYLLAGGLVILGYAIAKKSLLRSHFSFLAIWISVPIALFAYGIFATNQGLALYRLFTFVYAPTSILAAIALIGFVSYAGKKASHNFARSAQLVVGLTVLAIVLLSSYQSYAAVVQNQNLLGGQWAYRQSDFLAANWTNKSVGSLDLTGGSTLTLAGDTKILYLYGDYFGLSIDTQLGYNVLTSASRLNPEDTLVTYSSMAQNGYNLFLYGLPLPNNWQASLEQSSSLVYDNGNERIWK